MESKAPKTKAKKSKKSEQTKKTPTNPKKSITTSSPEPAEVPTPAINSSTGLPNGYFAAKPSRLHSLLTERDSFAEYTCQVLDPNESLVMHGWLAKIQEKAKKWNRGVRLQEVTKDIKELASEVVDMDDEEMAEAEERVTALRNEVMEFEKKVAERKALDKTEGVNDKNYDLLKGKNAPEGKDMGSGGDDEDDMEEKGNEATGGGAQKGKKRKRGAN